MPNQEHKQDTLTQDKAAVESLQGFLKRDHSPKLNEFKESVREGVGIMIEIMDEETGIPLCIFAQGEDSSILNKKATMLDKVRRRAARDFQEWLEKFANMADRLFKPLRKAISWRIKSIKTNAETEIKNLETVLSAVPVKAASGKGREVGEAFQIRKNRLKDFVRRLSTHSENLNNAKSTGELLEVEADLEEEVIAFDNNTAKKKSNNLVSSFFVNLYASSLSISTAPQMVEGNPYDVFEELDIDPHVTASDEEDEGETGSADDLEEELTY